MVLAVNEPHARPGFDTRRMAYTRRPYEIEYFARNQWVDAPARMLAPILLSTMERSGLFRSVVAASSGLDADLRLDTELVRLEQDFATTPSRVRITLRAQLVDLRRGKVLATRTFDGTEPASADDPYGGVAAANKVLATMLPQITAFCAHYGHTGVSP